MQRADLKDLVRGDTYGITMTFKDENDVAIDITGRTLTFAIKRNWNQTDADAALSHSEVVPVGANATNGIGTLTVPAADTRGITPGVYVYDIEMRYGSSPEVVTTLVGGKITVQGDIAIGA